MQKVAKVTVTKLHLHVPGEKRLCSERKENHPFLFVVSLHRFKEQPPPSDLAHLAVARRSTCYLSRLKFLNQPAQMMG